MTRIGLLFALLVGALNVGTAVAAESGTALKTGEVKVAPYRDAKSVAVLTKGDKVEILKRQGGWYQIKSAKGDGWVRVLGIRRAEARKPGIDAGGILGLASGRAGTGQVVATTGIRGLTEEELKNAKFNESEVKKAESFAASRTEAQKFAAAGKLVAQKVDYLPSPD